MKINKVLINQFRNIEKMEFSPSKGINIIVGENGQGKTNLIEAMWMCTGMRSFRGATQSQMISFKKDFTNISMDYYAFSRERNIFLGYHRKENKKEMRLNGVDIALGSDFSGNFCATVFSPSHLELISGSPESRRRFVDTIISQIRPYYDDLLLKYQKTLDQRNHMLRNMAGGRQKLDKNLLFVWNESLAALGASIMEYRFHILLTLKEKAFFYYNGISRGKEDLEIKYNSSIKIPDNKFILSVISTVYREKLEESLETDLRLGFTSFGVHRDDIDFLMNGLSAKSYSSQGQKRSIVLSLKLGESDILKESTGEEAVIFLDDILSELDEHRSEYVMNYIQHKQVFITCCDAALLGIESKGEIYTMRNGTFV